jgi:hypothetical protein
VRRKVAGGHSERDDGRGGQGSPQGDRRHPPHGQPEGPDDGVRHLDGPSPEKTRVLRVGDGAFDGLVLERRPALDRDYGTARLTPVDGRGGRRVDRGHVNRPSRSFLRGSGPPSQLGDQT